MPHHPKAGNGRPAIGLQRMLRIHLLQHWFNLADEAMEGALYDSASLRAFVAIDLGCARAKGTRVALVPGAFNPLGVDDRFGRTRKSTTGR